MQVDHSSKIRWLEWSDEAFDKAEKEDKLILLNISASWCHWCHLMDRTTYSNPQVIQLVNDRFVPIKVDGDKRPDVEDKYLLGGWPTTAFLLPDGRILTGTTFMPPEGLAHKLHEVDALYHEQKPIVTMHVTSMAAEAEYDRSEAETGSESLDGEAIGNILKTVKDDFDPKHGGFGTEPKFPFPDAVRFVLLQYHRTGDKELLEIARKSLNGMTGIYDPVWGGFFRYAVNADWTEPHYEKMLYVQADIMDNYVEMYQVTGEDKYGEVAAGTKAYVTRFLSDQEQGGFYGSQDADVNSHEPNAELILGEDYYPKNEDERMAMGIPYIDKTLYTDWNGMMASVYFQLYHAMGDKHARDFALKTIDRMLESNLCGDLMCHYSNGDAKIQGWLSDQVYFAQALVDAYQTTGLKKYLASAEKLSSFMVEQLQDVVEGGFYSQPYDPHAKGELSERHKPFDENVTAAKLFVQLHHLTGYNAYRELAERTLKSAAHPGIQDHIIGSEYATVLDLALIIPVHIVIVGDTDNEQTQKMLETALHAYEPGKLVQVLDPKDSPITIGEHTYETQEEPVAYVCVQNVCREPIKGHDHLAKVLEEVLSSPAHAVS